MEYYQRTLVAIDIYCEYDQILKRALSVVKKASQLSVVFVTLPTTYFQAYICSAGVIKLQIHTNKLEFA
jgi:universal stress protein A